MYRQKITELKQWKDNPRRKPLIMRGARQVGKTWLLREFGREHYRQTVYINFESAKELRKHPTPFGTRVIAPVIAGVPGVPKKLEIFLF